MNSSRKCVCDHSHTKWEKRSFDDGGREYGKCYNCSHPVYATSSSSPVHCTHEGEKHLDMFIKIFDEAIP